MNTSNNLNNVISYCKSRGLSWDQSITLQTRMGQEGWNVNYLNMETDPQQNINAAVTNTGERCLQSSHVLLATLTSSLCRCAFILPRTSWAWRLIAQLITKLLSRKINCPMHINQYFLFLYPYEHTSRSQHRISSYAPPPPTLIFATCWNLLWIVRPKWWEDDILIPSMLCTR